MTAHGFSETAGERVCGKSVKGVWDVFCSVQFFFAGILMVF